GDVSVEQCIANAAGGNGAAISREGCHLAEQKSVCITQSLQEFIRASPILPKSEIESFHHSANLQMVQENSLEEFLGTEVQQFRRGSQYDELVHLQSVQLFRPVLDGGEG